MAVQGVTSTRYESWIGNLKAVEGKIRKRIMQSFAATLGDRTYEWLMQTVLEHLPGFASDESIALIASERQMDTALGEAASSIAARAPYWLQLARFSGSGLGILLGLHFSGYEGAVLVQQNGRALSLTLPLPDFVLGQAWDPTPNLVVTACSELSTVLTSTVNNARTIPAGFPWFAFDGDTDFSSRFAVVFPGALQRFTTYGTATFTGVEDGSTVAWPFASWTMPFLPTFTAYDIMPGIPKVTSAPPFPVICSADSTSLTGHGVRVRSSYPFTGSVDVKATVAPNASTIKSLIQKWKPAKATCIGVYEIQSGRMWDWPTGLTWDGGAYAQWDAPHTVTQMIGSF